MATSLPYESATSGKNAVEEMQKILRGFGASSFGCMEDFDKGEVIVQFVFRDRPVTVKASSKGYAAAWLNSRYQAWTQSGFRASFFKLIGALAKDGKIGKGLTFHGLRSTHAHDWASRGDTRTIGLDLGDKTESMARHYAQEEGKGRRLKAALKEKG